MAPRGDEVDIDIEVVVVGAGMSGLFALKALRDRGVRAVVLEKGTGVGGTWFWNRYPGARCDIPSLEYSFGFDPDLEQEWEWTEHFASQPEIERYLNHIADRYDLRPDIRLSTSVTAMVFDERDDTWVTDTDTGERIRSRFAVMATGGLSAAVTPDWPGMDSFAGTVVQTSSWPADGIDLDGKRIGVVGTGSSGVQLIPELAERAAHLTVFQRTAAFTWPSHNRSLSPEDQAATKARYRELRNEQRVSFTGTAYTSGARMMTLPTEGLNILEATREERAKALEEHGFDACRIWSDAMTDLDANELAAEQFREMVRRTVVDPGLAEALSPRGYPLHCKRPVLDTGYFETFNRPNVDLVDLRVDPIVEVQPEGIRTAHRTIGLDVLVLATGFDAMTGALTRIDIRGRDGRSLREDWAAGPATYLGIATAGFPNLFVCVGPGSPGVLATYPPQIELQVGWICDLIAHLVAHDLTRAEATADAQREWTEHVDRVAGRTMFMADSCRSWYNGSNVDGKPRTVLAYVGGLPRYMKRCNDVAAKHYEGFELR